MRLQPFDSYEQAENWGLSQVPATTLDWQEAEHTLEGCFEVLYHDSCLEKRFGISVCRVLFGPGTKGEVCVWMS